MLRRTISLAAASAVLITTGSAWAMTEVVQSGSGVSQAPAAAGSAGVSYFSGSTILLVGSDARTDADGNPLSAQELAEVGTEDDGGGTNTDTIMLLHIPPGGRAAGAVSIPRDTWMGPDVMKQVDGPYSDGTEGPYRPNKINSYYGTAKEYTAEHLRSEGVSDGPLIERESDEAGRAMLIRVLQAYSGLKIDHYAEVSLLSFYLLSDAIGGVPVCLNESVDDPWSGADFPAGPQLVQGSAALAFVRQRHGLPGGDLDRVARQQAFLQGALSKVLSAGTLTNPGKLADLVSTVRRSVVFDSGFDLMTFAEQLSGISTGEVTFATLPTDGPEPTTDTDALGTDPAVTSAFFGALASDQTTSTPATTAAAPVTSSVKPAGPAQEPATDGPKAPGRNDSGPSTGNMRCVN